MKREKKKVKDLVSFMLYEASTGFSETGFVSYFVTRWLLGSYIITVEPLLAEQGGIAIFFFFFFWLI